jgi:hypothetical protein
MPFEQILAQTTRMLLLLLAAPLASATAKEDIATGRLRLTFTERSPLSSEESVRARYNDYRPEFRDGWVRFFKYDLLSESFDVYVPGTYKPDVPHGLFVWFGVSKVPDQWFEVLARRKLIYLKPNQRTPRRYLQVFTWTACTICGSGTTLTTAASLPLDSRPGDTMRFP